MLRATLTTIALAAALASPALATPRETAPSATAPDRTIKLAHHKPGHKGGPPGRSKKNKGHGGDQGQDDDDQGHRYRRGGPPPWAPAHGYRYKNGHRYSRESYRAPFEIDKGRCNKQALGTALGAATGGVIAAKVAEGDRQKLAILGGVVLGAIVGNLIGKSMDDVDQACVGGALEHASDGEKVRWSNQRGDTYTVIPQRTRQTPEGRFCREYATAARIAGVERVLYGTACRLADGTWELINR